jgi:hypothetical protein
MLTLEYEMTVYKNYNVIEEILEENGKGETNIINNGRMEQCDWR